DLLLENMKGQNNRKVHYEAVICLVWNGEAHYFKGTCEGTLLEARKGGGGFGYDPIFMPDGYNQTFGELAPDIKNSISHRGKAIRQMAAFIKEQNQK
ncbi:MAG: non-canonical purine NTP pyrophosphatase, partial [Sphingobacteriales bacterium]